jgi:hypothetical protein
MASTGIQFERAKDRRFGLRSAFTLIEVMLSILIIMVLATGAMGYQYFAVRDVKHSEVQAGAARLGLLVLEKWKGAEGDAAFDPVSEFNAQLEIQAVGTGPAVPDNAIGLPLTPLGFYQVRMEGITYYLTPAWDAASILEPMLLNVTIAWRRDYAPGALAGDEPFVRYSTYYVQD